MRWRRWATDDKRQGWVDEVTDHKIQVGFHPSGLDATPMSGPRYEYRQFDVRGRDLAATLTHWGSFGWRCHTQSPNKTETGRYDGTVWVLMERIAG
jgi:hypothetical protein